MASQNPNDQISESDHSTTSPQPPLNLTETVEPLHSNPPLFDPATAGSVTATDLLATVNAAPQPLSISLETIQSMPQASIDMLLSYGNIDAPTIQRCMRVRAPPYYANYGNYTNGENNNEVYPDAYQNYGRRSSMLMLDEDSSLRRDGLSGAIQGNQVELVQYLFNQSEDSQGTYVHEAVQAGYLPVVEFLVANGADTKATTSHDLIFGPSFFGLNPAQIAARHGNADILEYLLGLCPVPEESKSEWQMLTFLMLTKPQNFRWDDRVVRLLIREKLVNLDLPNEHGSTLLHVAIKQNHPTQARFLLSCGASAVARDRTGKACSDLWQSLKWPGNILYELVNAGERSSDRFKDSPHALWYPGPGKLECNEIPGCYMPGSYGFMGMNLVEFLPKKANAEVAWITMEMNNDAYFTAFVSVVSDAQGYDAGATSLALQLFSSTFMQHDSSHRWRRFREPSYNAFTLAKKSNSPRTNLRVGQEQVAQIDESNQISSEATEQQASQEDEPSQPATTEYHADLSSEPRSSIKSKHDTSARQDGEGELERRQTANIMSLAVPYFDSRLKNNFFKDRTDLVDCLDSVTATRNNALNIHEPRTLDESYYVGLNDNQLEERNEDQVINRLGRDPAKHRLLMVSQLWLWRMDDVVVSACGTKQDESDQHADPQTYILGEFLDGNMRANQDFNSLQLAALIFSECVNFLDRPNCAALSEPIFYTFERALAVLYDEVQKYMDENLMERIQINDEREFIHQISDIRDELMMIKNVVTQQGEVWEEFYKDIEKEVGSWDANIVRIAIRPKTQIPKFLRRIQKIDDDAQRTEQWIQVQLELKKTHAGLRESHNSTILSTAVIGFTIVTIVFTPLSFMTSLLAVPADQFTWKPAPNKYQGKTFTTVAEIVTLVATGGMVWLSIWFLKMRETRANIEDKESRKMKKNKTRWKKSIDSPGQISAEERNKVDTKLAWFKGFRRRSQNKVDIEQRAG